MTDIFQEVEDDVRRERYARLWKKYGGVLITAIVLILAGVGGWQLWQHQQQNKRFEASNAYIAAMNNTDPSQGVAAFAKLAVDAPGGYATIARMQEANALLASGRREQALALYTKLMGGEDKELADVARLRLAWAQADTLDKAQLQKLVAPLTDPGNAFNFMANELLAYADYRQGNLKEAQARYDTLAKNPETPQGIKTRAGAMRDFLIAGGPRDIGTVPPPQVQEQPATEPVQAP